MINKEIAYIDLDQVCADFIGAIKKIDPTIDARLWTKDVDILCENNPYIFHDLEPIKDSIESVKKLFDYYDIYFLSTPMWNVPLSFAGKRIWVEKHFGDQSEKRLVLTHRKDLAHGHYLIDDSLRHGADKFRGKHIHFATPEFPDWKTTLPYMLRQSPIWYGYIDEFDISGLLGILQKDYCLDKEVRMGRGLLTKEQNELLCEGTIIRYHASHRILQMLSTDGQTWI